LGDSCCVFALVALSTASRARRGRLMLSGASAAAAGIAAAALPGHALDGRWHGQGGDAAAQHAGVTGRRIHRQLTRVSDRSRRAAALTRRRGRLALMQWEQQWLMGMRLLLRRM
jgi:hypothetical protein